MKKLTLSTLFLALPAMCAFAGIRHFTFLYEAPTSPPGSVELENTISWAHGAGWNNVSFREELEIGITCRLQLGIYPLDWSRHSDGGFEYNGSAVELIYNLSNPVVDPVGISLYQEISVARQHFESESKLIAQKNFGRWIVDYNATLEAEWEDRHLGKKNGELQQALGASYEISPRLSVGLEFLHEFVLKKADPPKVRAVICFFFSVWLQIGKLRPAGHATNGERDCRERDTCRSCEVTRRPQALRPSLHRMSHASANLEVCARRLAED